MVTGVGLLDELCNPLEATASAVKSVSRTKVAEKPVPFGLDFSSPVIS